MKKSMKHVGIFLIAMLVFAMAGCSNDTSNGTEKKAAGKKSDYPTKPITLIAPSSAGGGTDATARALTADIEKYLGQSVGVVNKPGGSGSVGMTEGANAKPDGYTVTMVFVELTMYKHLGLSPLGHDQFKPIGLINLDPAALTVPKDAPYDTLEEFIAYAKEHPGKVKVGNSGTGSIWHIAAESISKKADVKFNHVPFEGAAQAVTALVGGHVDAVTVSPAEVKAQLDAGKVKTLAVMSDSRSDIIPDVPTFKEAGLDVDPVGTWRGLTVPKDTPDDIVAKLEDAFMKAAKDEKFTKFMASSGLGIELKDSKEFKKFMDDNYKQFGEILSDIGLSK
ncbi:tripartite tricarboxylate transporter substrate binding protein [Neobacillus niacini]|uniref:tripartite tricarboxylate transporter substrate binding protein n=1 Tax=Neobacillus niacini TaxID=86668 RepID=UPI0021CB1641|nr:tripartite tricarboxylate transporter substrate binding protein [Neobacillus niacini]MCM3763860.1 tripartite tricarboxylate transporter substrate binding protein [Neobacillus niacini]